MPEFEYKKSFGQNFIKDKGVINKIVDEAKIDKDTLVIEIGPGAGALSKKIIPLSGFSILYEIDDRLKDILDKELSIYNNYKIIFNDVLKQNISDDIVQYNYSKVYVVANLPYYITTPIITKVMNEIYPDKIIIMVQDEVADRLCAKEGSKEYGMITVLLGSRYKATKLFKVNRNLFKPVPNVDSAVISFVKNKNDNIKDINKFEKIIKDAFQFKRKNLRNNLKKYDLIKIENKLKENNFSLTNRAEEIPIKVFEDIANDLC